MSLLTVEREKDDLTFPSSILNASLEKKIVVIPLDELHALS